MTRSRYTILITSALSVALLIPATLTLIITSENPWFRLLSIFGLMEALGLGTWVVRGLRQAQRPVGWVLSGWASGTLLLPIATLVIRDVFGAIEDTALIVAAVMSFVFLLLPVAYIGRIRRHT